MAKVTAPVPAPSSRTEEEGVIGERLLARSRRRAAEREEVRPTFEEYVGAVIDQDSAGWAILVVVDGTAEKEA